MNVQITLQERLKDLRTERHISLKELSEQTQISSSALGNYENDDYKEINHGNLVILADFYDVTVDYLLGRTDIRKHEKTPIKDLHLSDEAVDLLMSGKINNRLLCELITHEKFTDIFCELFHLEGKVDDEEKRLLQKVFRKSELVNPKAKKKK